MIRLLTNITFNITDSWEKIFAGTAINIQDLYYIMARVTDDVTSLRCAFYRCKSLEVYKKYPLCRYTFIKCTNVQNIEGIFL